MRRDGSRCARSNGARSAENARRARLRRQWLEGASNEKRVRPTPSPEVNPEPPVQLPAVWGVDADEEAQSYFAVNLFVAALGDGKLILEGARKRKDILEQVVRNVSKEQNTVVYVPKDGTSMHLKMRVFVESSIEAKAVIDYIASQPSQACTSTYYRSARNMPCDILPAAICQSRALAEREHAQAAGFEFRIHGLG